MHHELRRKGTLRAARRQGRRIDKGVTAIGAEEVEGVVGARPGWEETLVRDGHVVRFGDRRLALIALVCEELQTPRLLASVTALTT